MRMARIFSLRPESAGSHVSSEAAACGLACEGGGEGEERGAMVRWWEGAREPRLCSVSAACGLASIASKI